MSPPDPISTHDPAHQPPGWADRLPRDGCAVFLSDPRTAGSITPGGRPTSPTLRAVCYPFDSLAAAMAWCQSLVATHEAMHCEIFDARGRAAGPIAEVLSHRYARRLPSRGRANVMLALSILMVIGAFPLIWFDWHVHNLALVWPTFFGLNLFTVGVRVFAWSITERRQAAGAKRSATAALPISPVNS